LLLALLCALTGAVLTIGASTPATAAPTCFISGNIYGPNPAQVGDVVGATASVQGTHSGCNGLVLEIRAGGHVYCLVQISDTQHGCQQSFVAYMGLSQVYADLSNGTQRLLGTFTVVGSTGTPTVVHTTVHVTVPPPTQATTAATATASSTAATAPAGAFPTAPPGAFDAESTVAEPSPTASASPSFTDTAPAVPVAIIHGTGSVSLIPPALLVVALVVFAGVFGAAARYIYLNTRGPLS
jgi:hypothetical protein